MFEKEDLPEIACRTFQERYEKNGRSGMYTLGFMDGYNKAKEDADKMKSQFLELCNLKDMRIAELEKANEWHYPSKGEYPKEYEDILICFLTEDDMKDCIRGWYEYDLDEDEHYFKTVNTFGTEIIKKPYAWKEIRLPETKESE